MLKAALLNREGDNLEHEQAEQQLEAKHPETQRKHLGGELPSSVASALWRAAAFCFQPRSIDA